jgi:hypothetical protein
MKNKKVNLNKKEPFNPDNVFRQMLELYNKVPSLDFSNKKKGLKLSEEIRKEMKRLKKMLKKFHKGKIAEIKKKQKDAK